MKEIMFNDRYGLTQAVKEGRKTMTRRIATALNHPNITDISEWGVDNKGKAMLTITYDTGLQEDVYPHFQIGEIVAVAQRYKDIYPNADFEMAGNEFMTESAGWNNKMFVKADLMPYRICITDITVERLQEITDEEILKEGIMEYYPYIYRNPEDKLKTYRFRDKKSKYGYYQLYPARDCFAELIDRISGKGTWESNPWVFAYEFELVK